MSLSQVPSQDSTIRDIHSLRHFIGNDVAFWHNFLTTLNTLSGAHSICLFGQRNGSWKELYHYPQGGHEQLHIFDGDFEEHAEVCQRTPGLCRKYSLHDKRTLIGLGLVPAGNEPGFVLFFLFDQPFQEAEHPFIAALPLLADTYSLYCTHKQLHKEAALLPRLRESLEVMALLNLDSIFIPAAQHLCNEIANRYNCSRVSLGWKEGEYLRLQAVSHMDHFDKKMAVVQALEEVMEEAADQDTEICVPPPKGQSAYIRAHKKFTDQQQVCHALSLPVRLDDTAIGCLYCERQSGSFLEDEIYGLRVLVDMTARRLGDLKKESRWLGRRILDQFKRPRHQRTDTMLFSPRSIALVLSCLLLLLFFWQIPYRIEAPYILKTDAIRSIPAPFDGYIETVHARIGDRVEAGTQLLNLDTSDLLLEESAASANLIRYQREAEKSRGTGALAEMKIAKALANQAQAQLDILRHRLDKATLIAPMEGIIVEGDLKKMEGAPVTTGDILYKIAQLKDLFVSLDVSEEDIHEITQGAPGEIAFISQPQHTFPIAVAGIEPRGVARESGTIFHCRGTLIDAPPKWWRPGMSGIAKIDAGRRSIAWIATHRSLDFLRLHLWF